MINEVYMIHDEPGLDTHRCQRVWLPNCDLIINRRTAGTSNRRRSRAADPH